jgi:hypothetical protein
MAMFKVMDVREAEIVFGAGKIDEMLPKYEEIPEEFKGFNSTNKWVRLVTDMFFKGLKSIEMTPKEGVDKEKAFKHIRAVMVSWRPKHEHKTAGCAFLFSEWFEDVQWEAGSKEWEINDR